MYEPFGITSPVRVVEFAQLAELLHDISRGGPGKVRRPRQQARQALQNESSKQFFRGRVAHGSISLLERLQIRTEKLYPIIIAIVRILADPFLGLREELLAPYRMPTAVVEGLLISCEELNKSEYRWGKRSHLCGYVLYFLLFALCFLPQIIPLDREVEGEERVLWEPVGAVKVLEVFRGDLGVLKE